ncbi:MAG: DUF2945 domain-containing protein [Hyphomicrobiales bacterium]|nr:DUF2945 domain-containing protein [Hyphomicrobiales bacterium]
MTTFKKGDEVSWKWGSNEARGRVVKKYTDTVTREIKGKEITRKASEDEPAYLIEQEDGDEVLKSASELSRA